MKTHEELAELLASSQEPEGLLVYAPDGRAFFLTNEDAMRTAIRTSRLGTAFQALQRLGGLPPATSPKPMQADPCSRTWQWLETHSPHSERWRKLCLLYFELC